MSMTEVRTTYDVLIIGSGPAGCATALLYAKRGLKVGLLEKSKDKTCFKPICTHFVQGAATPILKKIGVIDDIEAVGSVKNFIQLWTQWGWIKPDPAACSSHHGYNIRRQSLDPIMRKHAEAHPNITLLLGSQLDDLIYNDNNQVIGAQVKTLGTFDKRQFYATLIVGAEGRKSVVARKVNATYSKVKNNRTFFVSYYKDLTLKTNKVSQLWFWRKDVAYAFPCDGNVTLLCVAVHDDDLPHFKQDAKTAFHEYFKQLPDGPDMDNATRVAKVMAGPQMDTLRAHHTVRGVALVGDAKLAIDPYAGTGIAFAMLSADWLVESSWEAIRNTDHDALEASLKAYDDQHKRRLKDHEWMISSYSSGRSFNYLFPPERALMFAAVHDQSVANTLDLFLNRVIGFRDLFSYTLITRLIAAQIKRGVGSL